jgi:hypothetical protein
MLYKKGAKNEKSRQFTEKVCDDAKNVLTPKELLGRM